MRSWLIALVTIAVAVAVVGALPGAGLGQAPPATVGYAGTLTRSGAPYDGALDIEASLFVSASPTESETPLWSETHPAVRVRGGAFALALGAVEPLSDELLTLAPLYLAITIDGGSTGPRQPFEAVPFARLGQTSRTTEYPDGVFVGTQRVVDADGFWTGAGSETLESLACAPDQAPFHGADRWACINVGDDASFAAAGQECGADAAMSAIDNAGLPVCADLSEVVSQTDLATDGYLTPESLDALGLFGPENAPAWPDLDSVPAGFLDNDDAVTGYTGEFPVEVDGTTARLSGTGCDVGDWLVWDGGFACAAPPALSCSAEEEPMPATSPGQTSTVTVECPENTIRAGGGFLMSDVNPSFDNNWNSAESSPTGDRGWRCEKDVLLTSGTCYVVCCS